MGKVDFTKVKALEVIICKHISYNLKTRTESLSFNILSLLFSPFPRQDLYLSRAYGRLSQNLRLEQHLLPSLLHTTTFLFPT